jgi:hypothetical protein
MLQKYVRLTKYIQGMVRSMSAVLNPFLKLRNWNCLSYSSFIFENEAANILTTAWDLFIHSLIYLFIYSFTYLLTIHISSWGFHKYPVLWVTLSYRQYRQSSVLYSDYQCCPLCKFQSGDKHSWYCDITLSLNIQATNFESSRKIAL